MDGWIIVQTFTNLQDAYMAKGWLESAGIEVVLKDELTTQMNNFYSNASGGVKLLVRETEAEEVVRLLVEGGYLQAADLEKPEDWVWVKRTKDRMHCPFCQSDNIAKSHDLSVLAVIVYFILGALFPLFRPTFKCYDCGKAWKYKR